METCELTEEYMESRTGAIDAVARECADVTMREFEDGEHDELPREPTTTDWAYLWGCGLVSGLTMADGAEFCRLFAEHIERRIAEDHAEIARTAREVSAVLRADAEHEDEARASESRGAAGLLDALARTLEGE